MPQAIAQLMPVPGFRLSATMLLLAVLMAACATPEVRAPQTDALAYQKVTDAVVLNDCAEAMRGVAVLQAEHPQSRHLPDAYLESAYTCLRTGDVDATETLAAEFLNRFPDHRSEGYGHYLRGLAAYARWRALPPDASGARSAELAREAFGRFRELLAKHPDSSYGADVRPVLLDLREGLARVELQAIREDLSARRYAAVIPRARYLLAHYGNTEAAPYALAALADAHIARGEEGQARRLRQQIESDWPGHPVLRDMESR